MSDCLWHGGGHQPEHGVQAICELIADFIPRLGFNPATDVQVLCPMTRGVVGTRNLNTVLQQLINPPSPNKVEINRGGNLLREGDVCDKPLRASTHHPANQRLQPRSLQRRLRNYPRH